MVQKAVGSKLLVPELLLLERRIVDVKCIAISIPRQASKQLFFRDNFTFPKQSDNQQKKNTKRPFPLRSSCHAIENLNFREAVDSYRALCCHEPSAGANSDEGNHEGGGDVRSSGAAPAAAVDAAHVIVERFVRDGGPEQVSGSVGEWVGGSWCSC